MAARCIGVMCKVMPTLMMPVVIDKVIALFENTKNLYHRQGATETIYCTYKPSFLFHLSHFVL
jgi:hypothetical protein